MADRHPGLRVALDTLRRGRPLTADDIGRLERQLHELERRAGDDGGPGRDGAEPEEPATEPAAAATSEPHVPEVLPGWATAEGTARFAAGPGRGSVGFYRRAQGLSLSSVGIGTYHGAPDGRGDEACASAVQAALAAGMNVVDTSLNYRHQRAERSVGAALRRHVAAGGRRDEVVVCTKAGFLVPGAVTPGTVTASDVVAGNHALAPAFLTDQLARSRHNLGLEVIDVYYLHNPEVQRRALGRPEFDRRMRAAFEQLERAAADGAIRHYGTATWHGYRDGSLSLPELVALARAVGGDDHRFRVVQLPVNLGSGLPGGGILAQAADLGVTVVASASLMQGRLARDLPGALAALSRDLPTDAQRAVQFARSTPGITTALVGMRRRAHVIENAAVARVPPLAPADHARWASLSALPGESPTASPPPAHR